MSAIISDCGKYRYWLERQGDPTMQPVAFVMLNPSTADAHADDPTIRRCRSFAKGASFVVVNLYAFRATNPEQMLAAADPRGSLNDCYLARAVESKYTIVAAWGTNANWKDARDFEAMCKAFRQPIYCLGITKGGHPRHPLYVRGDQPFVRWA